VNLFIISGTDIFIFYSAGYINSYQEYLSQTFLFFYNNWKVAKTQLKVETAA